MSEAVSHKERTRQRILDEAAAIMRVVGTEGIGVARADEARWADPRRLLCAL
jgi:hypothetical protein